MPPTMLDTLPGQLPETNVPRDIEEETILSKASFLLNETVAENYVPYAIWRDFNSLADTFTTVFSATKVCSRLRYLSKEKMRSAFQITSSVPRLDHALDISSWYDVDFTFNTTRKSGSHFLLGHCAGTASLCVDENGSWKIWMLRTWLNSYDGYGCPDTLQPKEAHVPNSAQNRHGNGTDPFSFSTNRSESNDTYDVVIVGGGQAGLALAGRCQAVGLNYVVLEKFAMVGDVWRTRYPSLRWHTPKEYGELPFARMYKDEDPDLLGTARIAKAHLDWAELYGINIQTGVEVHQASYSKDHAIWTIKAIQRSGVRTLLSENLVICSAPASSKPQIPSWAQPSSVVSSGYQGTIQHSLDFTTFLATTPPLRTLVIGTANTGHDIAEALHAEGHHTTLLQRSHTFVLPSTWLARSMSPHYNTSIPAELGDRRAFTYPTSISRKILNMNVHHLTAVHAEQFDNLEKVGFKVDRKGDLLHNILERGGGHYIDTGASELISRGEIGVVNGEVEGLTATGLKLKDGREVLADFIVLATGFEKNARREMECLLGESISEGFGEVLGLDEQGEIKGLDVERKHTGLYFLGGDTRTARWYSRFLALKLLEKTLERH